MSRSASRPVVVWVLAQPGDPSRDMLEPPPEGVQAIFGGEPEDFDGAPRPDVAHFFVNDLEHPYQETKRFDWIRGYQVGGRSLTWGRQSYRWSDLDFEANLKDGIGVD